MRSLRIVAILGAFLISAPSFASYDFGFADVSLNRLFWSDATKAKATKSDFNYLEIEGGSQFSWGEMYGFFDIENILKRDANEVRTAAKGVIRYYLGKSQVSLYAHVYDFNAIGFSEQNRVIGLGYQFSIPQGWFKPFLGVHDVTQTFFNGLNGYMGGWVAGYGFKLFSEDFLATDWHEIEFARQAAYAAGNGGKSVSQNGAAAVWWNTVPQITFGLQWRYAMDKLGTSRGLNAGIASVRYNF